MKDNNISALFLALNTVLRALCSLENISLHHCLITIVIIRILSMNFLFKNT